MQPSAPGLVAAIPFAGLLASMALFPILAPRFWHRRMGVIALLWSVALVAGQASLQGAPVAAAGVLHAIVIEYLPFVTLLLALYAAGGGVLFRGGPSGTPLGNTAMLALGMAMGAVMGTTGASMVLIHPLLRANAHRRRKMHLVGFVIVLVANASGALTPLGNPPLYIGLLHGVPFFWPARHLFLPLLVLTGLLLAAFFAIDWHFAASEPAPPPPERFRFRGGWNVVLILAVAIAVLARGLIPDGGLRVLGQRLDAAQLVLVGVFTAVTFVSAWITPRAIRQTNDFTWQPMSEVAKLFAGIFVTVGPVLTMLQAGPQGPLAGLLQLSRDGAGEPSPMAFFWLTGILSAFLDNAPTYLVFFESAGIDPGAMSGHDGTVLAAISAGAVFFGGLTYIGNAPNMMLRAIAAHRGVRMPGFFGFMLLSALLLMPVLGLLSLLFFA